MNATQKKKLQKINGDLLNSYNALVDIQDELQGKLDNSGEGVDTSDLENEIGNLESLSDNIMDLIDSLSELADS